jgi:sugar lactone lactonase YvrE
MMKRLALLLALLALSACTGEPRTGALASWTFEETKLFPPDRSLTHAEDGVVLADGTLIVGDWDHGLLALSADGSRRPFGHFEGTGFMSRPALGWNSPNGISMEPDGRHLLIADITEGYIFRVDTETEAVTRILDHPFGVNSVIRDPSGAIWFTQSTENPSGPDAEARMFAAADRPLGDGAVYRLAPEQVGRPDPQPEKVIDGLDFANGIAHDADRGTLYVAHLLANQILAFELDLETGELTNRRVLAEVTTPDNLELDDDGMLWVAAPVANAVIVVDPDTGSAQAVFDPTPEAGRAMTAEWNRRLAAGESTLDLLGPDMWGPMPGLITGIILTPDGGPVYVSGLGDALIQLDR